MAVLKKETDHRPGVPDYYFMCPGCKCDHGVWVENRNGLTHAIWSFNGDVDKPTFSPSLLIRWNIGIVNYVCHGFIRNGMIEFLGDCTHEFAGKTVEMKQYD